MHGGLTGVPFELLHFFFLREISKISQKKEENVK